MTEASEPRAELEEDAEAVLILKTRKDLVAAATDRIRAAHSYDVPCVVVWDVVDGNPAYLDWICREWHEAVDSGMNIDRVRYFLEIRDMRPVERQPRRLMLVAEHACRWTGEEDSR